MEAKCSSENLCHTYLCYIPEYNNIHGTGISSNFVYVAQFRCLSSSSSSSSLTTTSALQPRVGLDLLKLMSPATSILGIRPPISTTQYPCAFRYPVNPSWFRSASPRWPPGFVHNIFLSNSLSSIRTTWPAHLSLLDSTTLFVVCSVMIFFMTRDGMLCTEPVMNRRTLHCSCVVTERR